MHAACSPPPPLREEIITTRRPTGVALAGQSCAGSIFRRMIHGERRVATTAWKYGTRRPPARSAPLASTKEEAVRTHGPTHHHHHITHPPPCSPPSGGKLCLPCWNVIARETKRAGAPALQGVAKKKRSKLFAKKRSKLHAQSSEAAGWMPTCDSDLRRLPPDDEQVCTRVCASRPHGPVELGAVVGRAKAFLLRNLKHRRVGADAV